MHFVLCFQAMSLVLLLSKTLVFHLLSSCLVTSSSPINSSLSSSSLTLSISTTVDRPINSVCCSTVTGLVPVFTFSFRCDFASLMRPVFDGFGEWLLGGPTTSFSFWLVGLALGGRTEFSFGGFSMMESYVVCEKQEDDSWDLTTQCLNSDRLFPSV